MRKQMVMGNWKMNGCLQDVRILLQDIGERFPAETTSECVIFPPSVYLSVTQEMLLNSKIRWGAQNVYPKDSGAFTGEISGPMLQDFQCRYVLVGHSERRHLLQEDEKFVAEKFHHVKDHDMIPVLCVGETLEERQKGLTEAVLKRQLMAVTHMGSSWFKNCVLAYEPVWAIGTGQSASPEQAQEAHAFIREQVKELDKEHALMLPILYGGSVNEKNARSLFAKPDVDGGLIGGASLNAQKFVEIVECIN